MREVEDKGPAEQPTDHDLGDEITTSGVACPFETRDTKQELHIIIEKLLGKKGASKELLKNRAFASDYWNYSN